MYLPPSLVAVLRYLGAALAATAVQLALLLGPAVVLAGALHALSAFASHHAGRFLGRAYFILFGWLGTVVHELGHALLCPLFGHRVTGLKLFDFAPRDGTLGFVGHEWDDGNPWARIGNFFIAVGPLVLGTVVIVLAARALLGPAVVEAMRPVPVDGALAHSAAAWATLGQSVAAGARAVLVALLRPERLADWRAWLFLYLAFAVGSSVTLSRADLAGAFAGFASLVLLLWLANLATQWAGDLLGRGLAWLAPWQAMAYAALLFTLLVNALAALALLPVAGLVGGVAALARRGGRAG